MGKYDEPSSDTKDLLAAGAKAQIETWRKRALDDCERRGKKEAHFVTGHYCGHQKPPPPRHGYAACPVCRTDVWSGHLPELEAKGVGARFDCKCAKFVDKYPHYKKWLKGHWVFKGTKSSHTVEWFGWVSEE